MTGTYSRELGTATDPGAPGLDQCRRVFPTTLRVAWVEGPGVFDVEMMEALVAAYWDVYLKGGLQSPDRALILYLLLSIVL